MNHAKLSDSPRLQFALEALRANPGLSTMEWQQAGRVTSASATKSELERNGVKIETWWDVLPSGVRVYRHKLASAVPVAASSPPEAVSLAREMVALRPIPERGEVWTVDRMTRWNEMWDRFVALVPGVKEQDELYLSVQSGQPRPIRIP